MPDVLSILVGVNDVGRAATVDPSHWIWNGVHPLPQGHELIARHWIEAVAAAWA